MPLALAALGGGLAGASRANSPASTMGTGLMTSMLGYYANQAATADERARRMRMEDEAVQRQRTADTQNEDYRRAHLLLQSGGFEPSLTGGPTDQKITFGQNSIYLRPKPQVSPEAWGGIISNAYGPDFAAQFTKSTAGMSPQQVQAMLPTFLESYKAAKQRDEGNNLFNTIGALGRETPKVTPEMELGMGTPPPMNPPSLTPAQVAMYQQAARFQESRPKAFEQIQQNLAELTPGAGAQAPPQAPSPGTSRTTQWHQDPKTKRWSQNVTDAPENPQRGLDTKETAVTIAEATRLEKSPGYKALYNAADASGKEALTTMLNLAKQGIPAKLDSLLNAMSNTGTTADTFDKAKLDYYRKTGQLGQVLQNAVTASDPDRAPKEGLVRNIADNIKNLEADLSLLPAKHPDYPMKAKRLAAEYRSLADASPKIWGKRAFQKMAELLGWSESQYKAEASAFAAQHGIPIKGGQ